MNFKLAFLAAACAATTAFAQTAGSPGAASPAPTAPGTPGSVSSGGIGTTTTNPSMVGVPSAAVPGSTTTPTPGTLPGAAAGGIGNSNSVAAQAQQRRQLALQQCQSLSGASRTDCIRTADDDFGRAVGSDTLAQQGQGSVIPGMSTPGVPETGGVAGNTRTTPDVSPTPRDNTTR